MGLIINHKRDPSFGQLVIEIFSQKPDTMNIVRQLAEDRLKPHLRTSLVDRSNALQLYFHDKGALQCGQDMIAAAIANTDHQAVVTIINCPR